MPAVAKWLGHAEATRRIMLDKYGGLTKSALVTATVEENVLVQLENLRTHPAVAVGIARGRVKLHGWVYKIETGQVFAFDPDFHEFKPLTDHYEAGAAPRRPWLTPMDGNHHELATAVGP